MCSKMLHPPHPPILCYIREARNNSIQCTQSGNHFLDRQCSCIYPTLQAGVRKTTKTVTFWDPLVETSQPHCSTQAPTHQSSKRETTSLKVSFDNPVCINGSKHKRPPQPLLHSPLGLSLYITSVPSPRCSHPR